MGLRRGQTPAQTEAAEAAQIGLIVPGLASAPARVAWLIAWRDRYRAMADSYARLAVAYENSRQYAAGRGERWAATYYARRARRDGDRAAAQGRAYATALATLAPDYDAPDGAGENVEAYRG